MIHSSYFKPKIFPYNGSGAPVEIDRLQELSGSTSLNRTKINEIGRDGIVGWKTAIPEVSLTLRQLEYGSLEFWNKITNTTATSITHADFKTSLFDIAGYKTDDNGTFLGTVWYPAFRTSGFGLSIGDPNASLERSFSFVGEDDITWSDNNKYVIYLERTASSSGTEMIVIGSGGYSTYPDPVADPDSSGDNYFIRCLRVRSGTTTELVEGTDFTYNSGTTTISVPSTQSSDVLKFYYTASTYISGADPFTENDTDLSQISADSVSIYLSTSNYVYRLQSVSLDVSFDRQDVKEIGNTDVVARGVRDTNVKVTLGRILENYTVEQILRGAASSTYGKYDVRKYQDDINLIIKVFSDDTKSTFKIGYKFTNLSPSSADAGVPTVDYVTKGTVLEGQELLITSSEGALA